MIGLDCVINYHVFDLTLIQPMKIYSLESHSIGSILPCA